MSVVPSFRMHRQRVAADGIVAEMPAEKLENLQYMVRRGNGRAGAVGRTKMASDDEDEDDEDDNMSWRDNWMGKIRSDERRHPAN